MKALVRIAACAAVLAGMQGCTTMPMPAHSSRYVGIVGPEGQTGYLPQACLAATSPGGQLPPGCANALNLVAMVADKKDLLRGREMGPALVAPAAAAVERYLGVVRDDDAKEHQERLISESGVSD